MMKQSFSVLSFAILLVKLTTTAAFVPALHVSSRPSLIAQASSESVSEGFHDDNTVSRRQVFSQTAATSLGLLAFGQTKAAWAADIGSSPDHPIVVLGAGGKVGKLCTEILADKGLYIRATTRSGRPILDSTPSFVSYAPADVTDYESLRTAIKGASGVIFAASASGKKKGGEPQEVDYVGLYNTGKACLANSVPKLVAVSAATVTRPDSAGFKATNFFVKYIYGDRIMDAKIAGEAALRDLYTSSSGGGAAYTIIRPGGLNDKPSNGASKLHVSQGDVYSAEISRQDVALVTVAALLKGKATDFTTFELNNVEGLIKTLKSLPDLPPELVHSGASSFDGLLDGLLTDNQMKQKYSDLINDFRGEGLKQLV